MEDERFANLTSILQDGWNLKLNEFIEIRGAYKVITSDGVKSLKISGEKSEKINFIYDAQCYLYENGFHNMAPLIKTSSGTPFYKHKKEVYILTPWIEGSEPSYKNITHLQMTAFTLAEMHCKSMGFNKRNEKYQGKYGKWPKKLAEKQKELVMYKKLAENGDQEFDRLFLEHSDWLISRTQQAIRLLNEASYKKLVSDAKSNNGYLCHGDTAVRNFILKENEIYFIDFDSMAHDLPVVDLWRLLRRTLRRNKWSADFINAVIAAYEQNRKLSREEKEVLFALLTFPERAWRIAHKYYEKRKESDWSAEKHFKKLRKFVRDREAMNGLTLDSRV